MFFFNRPRAQSDIKDDPTDTHFRRLVIPSVQALPQALSHLNLCQLKINPAVPALTPATLPRCKG